MDQTTQHNIERIADALAEPTDEPTIRASLASMAESFCAIAQLAPVFVTALHEIAAALETIIEHEMSKPNE